MESSCVSRWVFFAVFLDMMRQSIVFTVWDLLGFSLVETLVSCQIFLAIPFHASRRFGHKFGNSNRVALTAPPSGVRGVQKLTVEHDTCPTEQNRATEYTPALADRSRRYFFDIPCRVDLLGNRKLSGRPVWFTTSVLPSFYTE